jgi:hypothetical protein
MARRLFKTPVDYLVIAMSPALIIALVGSLVFFLLEVFYRGNYHGRLEYIFGLFVVGTVLIGRISIEQSRQHAAMFAVPLAVVALLAINSFVEFQGALSSLNFLINCGLLALVWWSADKLTWDCTLIDENEEDTGEGLLEVVGLDRPGKAAIQEEIEPAEQTGPLSQSERDRVRAEQQTGRLSRSVGEGRFSKRALDWWRRLAERRRRPHAPGVWVVYFSLAAVALFGIGQIFIPAGDPARRRYAFQLLFVYTASGLGLLLSTSFLGLRRYLRQRRQEMPMVMVNVWMTLGAALIAGVMLAALLLPRPNAEYPISELPFQCGSPDQKASQYGVGSDGVQQQQPAAKTSPSDDEKSGRQTESNRSDRSEKKSSDSGRKSSNGSQKSSGGSEKSSDKKESSPENRVEYRSDKEQSPKDQKGSTEKREGSKRNKKEGEKQSAGGKASSGTNRKPRQEPGQTSGGKKSTDIFRHSWREIVSSVVNLLKWLFYGAAAIIAAYVMWRNRRELRVAIRDLRRWILDLWHNLFHRAARQGEADRSESEPAPRRRFVDFADPFASGQAARWPPEELVRYTFEALEVWAMEHGCPRGPEQTPHEFARQIATSVSWLADDAAQLAELYSCAAYSRGALPASSVGRLRQMWRNLAAAEAPVEKMTNVGHAAKWGGTP